MKRDRRQAADPAGRSLERQLERLAPKLRETGIAPGRDLWPDIEAEIARREPGLRSGRGLSPWRIAALAASLLLVVGVGWVQWNGAIPDAGPDPAPNGLRTAAPAAPGPVAAVADEDPLESSRNLLDDALDRLREARRRDPDNTGLTKLVLMIQESRGDLIRSAAKRLDLPGR